MPWRDAMDQKLCFVEAIQSGAFTMTEACAAHGITRQTGHKWWRRYGTGGVEALEELSRAPDHRPQTTPLKVQRLLLALKRKHKTWGATKVLEVFSKKHPELLLPARSTVNALFDRNGLVKKRRARTRHEHPGRPSIVTSGPNDIWTADFKGQFRTGDGIECFPLTIVDQHSRYILDVRGLLSTRNTGVFPVFKRLFREHGLPRVIHTDNGTPFTTTAIHGFSELNVWWLRLGIAHSRTEPGKPQQNGAHERMHLTLKRETAMPAKPNLVAQQRRFNGWRHEFNEVRPHEYLDNDTPSQHWEPSPRPLPAKLPKPEYPSRFEKRLVSKAGTFRLKNHQIFISHLLAGDYLGLEEVDTGLWSVVFYDTLIARVDEREGRLLT